MSAYIYGYSVRFLRPDEDWTDLRRKVFLLNESVEIPKSVDPNVWEEVVGQMAEYSAGKVRLPCWSDREKMLSCANYDRFSKEMVALTIVAFPEEGNCLPQSIIINNVRSIDMPDGFFIGYDIADDGLTSALSNCGYSEAERSVAQMKYAKYLNRHGLFEDKSMAAKFVADSEIRVPDHSPFYIFGLYLDKPIP